MKSKQTIKAVQLFKHGDASVLQCVGEKISSVIDRASPPGQAADAHRCLESQKKVGKIELNP